MDAKQFFSALKQKICPERRLSQLSQLNSAYFSNKYCNFAAYKISY